ncbi:hypothetical protein [Maritalea porphyrae]|uniref:hypothetical protein n=1 Tax=Maritalea porphyrae TaxID=880732 RepID=UPI0022AEA7B8|nr:hypothetical protein [Maritalea porphyrae]MCZ4270891.1 hypothetical protein [Maritalea porphyrae]
MAGFGNPNGFGGMGANRPSFPMRQSHPYSTRVDSDDEFVNDWQSNAPSRLIGGSEPEYGYQMLGGAYTETQGTPTTITNADGTVQMLGGGVSTEQGTPSVERTIINPGTPQTENPEYAEYMDRFNNAVTLRQENQTRQQQNYNQMAGNGMLDGILGAEYSNPNFGQVTGQENNQSSLPLLGNPEGLDGLTAGAYEGLQSQGVYAPAARSTKPKFSF